MKDAAMSLRKMNMKRPMLRVMATKLGSKVNLRYSPRVILKLSTASRFTGFDTGRSMEAVLAMNAQAKT